MSKKSNSGGDSSRVVIWAPDSRRASGATGRKFLPVGYVRFLQIQPMLIRKTAERKGERRKWQLMPMITGNLAGEDLAAG